MWVYNEGFKEIFTITKAFGVKSQQEAAGSLNSGRSIINSLNWPGINLPSNYTKGNLMYTPIVSTMT